MIHWEVWDRETANMLGFYHTESVANERVARIVAANPDMPADDLVALAHEYECAPACTAQPPKEMP